MVSDLPAVDLFSMAHICMLLSDDQLRELFGNIHKTLIKDRHPGGTWQIKIVTYTHTYIQIYI